jgi:hypothetical protein
MVGCEWLTTEELFLTTQKMKYFANFGITLD